jgi:hypothetical protein
MRGTRLFGLAVVLLAVALPGAVVGGCGPSAPSVKANAQQARKAVDDIVYNDVELLLVPTVVMRTTEGTTVVTPKQAAAMKVWLARDLAVIENRAGILATLAKAPALGDSKTDALLSGTSAWLDGTYLPAIGKAVAGVAAGGTLHDVESSLGSPWSGTPGEQAKARIAALRAALAKKVGE